MVGPEFDVDLEEKIEIAIRSGHGARVEAALMACINDGGEHALSLVLELLCADFIDLPYKNELYSLSALAAANWHEAGLVQLYRKAIESNNNSIVRAVLGVLAYAASYDLHVASRVYLNGFDHLQSALTFLDEEFHQDEFVETAKECLFDLVLAINPADVGPSVILQTLVRLSHESSIIASAGAFNILLQAYISRWLRLNRAGFLA